MPQTERDLLGAQPSVNDVKAMTAYNLKVAVFNEQTGAFAACFKAYQDRAQHDIQQIRVAVRDAAADMRAQ